MPNPAKKTPLKQTRSKKRPKKYTQEWLSSISQSWLSAVSLPECSVLASGDCSNCTDGSFSYYGEGSVGWQTQLEDNWCWAAISAALGGSSQCELAQAWAAYNNPHFPDNECCDDPTDGQCNVGGYVTYGLHCEYNAGCPDLCDIIDVVSGYGGIGCAIDNGTPGGHCVGISGYACYGVSGSPQILIWDPWYPDDGGGWSWQGYDDFCAYCEAYYF